MRACHEPERKVDFAMLSKIVCMTTSSIDLYIDHPTCFALQSLKNHFRYVFVFEDVEISMT